MDLLLPELSCIRGQDIYRVSNVVSKPSILQRFLSSLQASTYWRYTDSNYDKWLDPAGIFHHICHFCDAQKPNINPDLTFILSTIDCQSEPDMSWIKGFYNGKPKKPAFPKVSPNIELLPPIQEDNEVDLPSWDRETPVKKRAGEQRRVRLDTSVEVSGYSMPPQLQWTPKAQRAEDGLESMHGELLESDEEQNSYIMSAQVQKKHKLWSWANSPETALPDQSFEDWL